MTPTLPLYLQLAPNPFSLPGPKSCPLPLWPRFPRHVTMPLSPKAILAFVLWPCSLCSSPTLCQGTFQLLAQFYPWPWPLILEIQALCRRVILSLGSSWLLSLSPRPGMYSWPYPLRGLLNRGHSLSPPRSLYSTGPPPF